MYCVHHAGLVHLCIPGIYVKLDDVPSTVQIFCAFSSLLFNLHITSHSVQYRPYIRVFEAYIKFFIFYIRPTHTISSDTLGYNPYPEPVYTGWSSVHWNATGMPLVDPVYTGIPLEKLSWNSPTLECHWRKLVESAPHWDATGETLTFAAYTGTPLEGLWQPTHAPTYIVKYAG